MIACAGNFCGKTLDHPKNRVAEFTDYLEKRFEGPLKSTKLKINVSGCPNGCARHLIANIGLQGTQLTFEGKAVPGYNVYVGGSTGSNVPLGRLIQRGARAEMVKFALANLIDIYLKNGANVSFTEFCNRNTAEELQTILNLTQGEIKKMVPASVVRVDEQRYALDVRGYPCPFPEIYTARTLEQLSAGQFLEVTLDNPASCDGISATVKKSHSERLGN